MAKQGTSSVFKRLFLLLLSLMVVIYTVTVGFFVRYVQQQRNIEMAGQITRVSNSASVIEQQIRAVENVKVQLLNDTRVKRLSLGLYDDAYEKTQLILDLLASIQNTQSINKMIQEIILVFPQEEIELSARNGYHRHEYAASEFHSAAQTSAGQLQLEDGELKLKVAYPLKNSLEETYIPNYEVCIVLSREYLDDFLENFRHEEIEGAFWVYNNGTTRVPLFTENAVEATLLAHWDIDWVKQDMPEQSLEQHSCEQGEYLCITEYLPEHGLILFTYQNTRALAWNLGGSLFQMSLIIVGMGLLFWLIITWANRAVNKPIRKIMGAFEKVRSGDLEVRIFHKTNDEFGYIYDSFNDTVIKIDDLIRNVKEQKELLQNAELMQLQSHINPHFLYNSFYNLKFMAQNEDYEQIDTVVTALARYYRFINKETTLDVTLQSEVWHMENYIEIQQMRFGDKIRVEKEDLPSSVTDFRVPKLILQPIIENAYNYGLKDKLNQGLLSICYRLEGKWLDIIIEDNGGSLTEEKLQQMRAQINTFEGEALNHAMTNIQRRLMLAYGEGCGLTLAINDVGGLRVTLRLNTTVVL